MGSSQNQCPQAIKLIKYDSHVSSFRVFNKGWEKSFVKITFALVVLRVLALKGPILCGMKITEFTPESRVLMYELRQVIQSP